MRAAQRPSRVRCGVGTASSVSDERAASQATSARRCCSVFVGITFTRSANRRPSGASTLNVVL